MTEPRPNWFTPPTVAAHLARPAVGVPDQRPSALHQPIRSGSASIPLQGLPLEDPVYPTAPNGWPIFGADLPFAPAYTPRPPSPARRAAVPTAVGALGLLLGLLLGTALGAAATDPGPATPVVSTGPDGPDAAALTERENALDTREAVLAARERAVRAREAAGVAGQSEAQTTVRPKVQAPATAPVPAPGAEPGRASGGTAYYPTCSAARADGVTPLHRGQPGYRSGLDRDGDGTACE